MEFIENFINASNEFSIKIFSKNKKHFTHIVTKLSEPEYILLIRIRTSSKGLTKSSFDCVEIFIVDEYKVLFFETNELQYPTSNYYTRKTLVNKYKKYIIGINQCILEKLHSYFNNYKVKINFDLDNDITIDDLKHTIQCSSCNVIKKSIKFQSKQLQCIACRSSYKRDLECINVKTFMVKLLNDAKHNAKHRLKTRTIAGECNINVTDLINVYHKQKGLCYYSNVLLSLNVKSDWQCSIERLDQTRGYIKENIVLIALEFNTASQMSKSKFTELLNLLNKRHNCIKYDFDKKQVTFKKIVRNESVIYNIHSNECTKCKIYKKSNEFRKNRNTCTQCENNYKTEYKKTPRGHLLRVLNSMIINSKNRNHLPPSITFDDLVEIFKKQKGLCYYTGIPMNFGSYKETYWTLSVERLNNTTGYEKKNIALVCWEFNVPHNQWSKSKVTYIKQLNSNLI